MTVKTLIIPLEPISAPRMTQRTAYKQEKYWLYRDALRLAWRDAMGPEASFPAALTINFYISMPRSWPKYKKAAMAGQPHQTKKRKDIDNLVKGVFDSLAEHDGYIWDVHMRKFWASEKGYIEIIFSTEQESQHG
jgi:Holliday junction resolvase RusA-like endonuclease